MSKVATIGAFLFGVAAGAATSWLLLKKMYQAKTELEIESVKKAYQIHVQNVEHPTDEEKRWISRKLDEDDQDLFKPVEIPEAVKYAREKNYIPDIPEVKKVDQPYVISPDEFGDLYEYEKVYLTFFADGAVADGEYDILTREEIDESIGFDSLTHFGEYEDDLVYVRNDMKRCDYEITKDNRNYSELGPEDF